MLDVCIAATRGRDPDNPSDRKHPSNGRFRQRLEIGGGYYQYPHFGKQRQLLPFRFLLTYSGAVHGF